MPARSRTRTAALVVASLLAHGLLLAVLLMNSHDEGASAPSHALQMELLPRFLRKPPATPNAAKRPQRRPSPAPAPVAAAPSIPAPLAQPSEAAPNPRADPGAFADAERLRSVLQGLTACGGADGENLAPELRRRCDDRAVRLAKAGGAIAVPGASQFAQTPQDPLLVRKPHNGCLPRVGDRGRANPRAGGAAAASTTAGVGCGVAF